MKTMRNFILTMLLLISAITFGQLEPSEQQANDHYEVLKPTITGAGVGFGIHIKNNDDELNTNLRPSKSLTKPLKQLILGAGTNVGVTQGQACGNPKLQQDHTYQINGQWFLLTHVYDVTGNVSDVKVTPVSANFTIMYCALNPTLERF